MTQQEIVDVLVEYERFKTGKYLDIDEIIPHAFKKLGEEYGELVEAHIHGHESAVALEIADIYITLCRVAEYYGISIESTTDKKVAILKERMKS